MKRVVSVILVLVMVLAIMAPIVSNAETVKEEVLFNKLAEYFAPYKNLDMGLVEEFMTEEVFVELAYELFYNEALTYDNLKEKLGDGSGLKSIIKDLITKENTLTILKELQAGVAKDSLPILKNYIEAVETYFEEDWDKIVDADLRASAKEILYKLVLEVEENVVVSIKDIEKHWAKDKIEALVKLGIIKGYPDGTFRPEEKISRAEFAALIVSALKLDLATYSGGFSDVKASDWHAKYVATMVANKYVSGYPDGSFKPEGKINRMEMATMLSNIIEVEFTAEEKTTLLKGFVDADGIQDWAKDAVAEVVKAKLMVGDNLGKFNPTGNATRAEAATVIYNLINR